MMMRALQSLECKIVKIISKAVTELYPKLIWLVSSTLDYITNTRIISVLYSDFGDLKLVGRYQKSKNALMPSNIMKNRYKGILPYDRSRVKLEIVNDEEGSDYINANYLMGFLSNNEYIATQGPLANTENDFWRMCWEKNVVVIVMLANCTENGIDKCHHYWPHGLNPVQYGDITVQIIREENFFDWRILRLNVSRENTSRILKHFQFLTWRDSKVPRSPELLNEFVKLVRSEMNVFGENPIVVHCSAGIGRTGTFIAVDRVLQLLRHTKKVDIFSIVYRMRHDRYSMVQTKFQYVFIYRCMLAELGIDHKFLDIPKVLSVDVGVRPIGDIDTASLLDVSKDHAKAFCSDHISEKVDDTIDKGNAISVTDIEKENDSKNIIAIQGKKYQICICDKDGDITEVKIIEQKDDIFQSDCDKENDFKKINITHVEFPSIDIDDKNQDVIEVKMIDEKAGISEMDIDNKNENFTENDESIYS